MAAKLEGLKCLPCINSKSLLMTVLRKRQCMRRNLGYCPTMYMILDAMIALLSFPLFCSQRPSKSFITITKNLFSSSSGMAPLMDPTAQHKVLRFLQDHSLPLTCKNCTLVDGRDYYFTHTNYFHDLSHGDPALFHLSGVHMTTYTQTRTQSDM